MKVPNFMKQLYIRYKHFSQESMADIFVAYSTLIAEEENPLHLPLTSKFVDLSRQFAQRRTYDILQADTQFGMYSLQKASIKDFNEYFIDNFEYSAKSYFRYYNRLERAIDRAKVDEDIKDSLYDKITPPYEQALEKIKSIAPELDKYYLMILNSTVNTEHRFL